MRLNRPSTASLAVAISLGSTFMAPIALATDVNGRFSAGGYASEETFVEESDGSTQNDFQTVSARMYLRLENWTSRKLLVVTDLRDKHDFFDKLDRERLHLTGSNEFQLREASVRYPNAKGSFYGAVGRFAIPEAGAVYTDGTELGSRLTPALRVSVFGGHNPKRPEEAYLREDTADIVYGAYLHYEPKTGSWTRFFNSSLGYTTNIVEGQTERTYLFHNMLYQWKPKSRVISNVYFDVAPRTYLQSGNLTYQKAFTRLADGHLQLTAYDAIEYSRRQGVLEQLPSSPYKDAAAGANYRLGKATRVLTEVRYGLREVDKKERKEVQAGINVLRLFSSRIDLTASGGYRQDFTVAGPTLKLGGNYYSRKWEFELDAETAVQSNLETTTGPQKLHPIVTQASIANFFSKSFFTTLSVEYSHNELVTIYSGFFRLTYRFGSTAIPPIRDGGAPQRSL